MFARTENFKRYVANASLGRTGLMRIVLGTVLAIATWLAVTIIVFVAGSFLRTRSDSSDSLIYNSAFAPEAVDDFVQSSFGQATLLLTFGGLWIGVWAALKIFHKLKLSSLLGYQSRIDWDDFCRAFLAFAIITSLIQLFSFSFDPNVVRNPITLLQWFTVGCVVTVFLFIQTSAEEVFFRGYLMQQLAARFDSVIIWAMLPIVCFIALHFTPGMSLLKTASFFALIGVLAITFTYLVVRTGNLGASMGVHFANNLAAIVLISHDDTFEALALYNGTTFEQMPINTVGEALATVAPSVLSILVATLLITHAKSPLVLKAFQKAR
jgi:uncharacterized protein